MLPAWVGWVGLIYIPVAFLASLALQGIFAAFAATRDRRARCLHWTDRARRIFPMIAATRQLSLLLCVLFGVVAAFVAGPLSHVGPLALVPALILAVLAGSFWPSWQLNRRLRATPPDARAWLRTYVLGVLIRSPLYLALVLGCALPSRFDAWVAIALGIAAAFVVFISLGGLTRMGRWLGILVPPSPRLEQAAASAAAATGARLRGVWLARVGFANAFALPMAGQIVVTEPATEIFDDNELMAVCAHELGHVSEGPRAGLSRLLILLAVLLLAAVRPVWGSFGGTAAVLLFVLVFAGLRLWPAIGRRFERRSDEAAHHHEVEPGTYARALEKLYAHELMPAVGYGKGGSHPHLYDRMLAAGVTPAYPRPAPPTRWLGAGAFLGVYLLLAPIAAAVGVVITLADNSRNPNVLLFSIGAFGRGSAALDQLAQLRWEQDHDLDAALALERRAAELSPGARRYAAQVVRYLTLVEARNAGSGAGRRGLDP
jgi:Zn-dependent protease with chaperone function